MIDAHSGEPFGVVRDLIAGSFLNREEILGSVYGDYSAVDSRFDIRTQLGREN